MAQVRERMFHFRIVVCRNDLFDRLQNLAEQSPDVQASDACHLDSDIAKAAAAEQHSQKLIKYWATDQELDMLIGWLSVASHDRRNAPKKEVARVLEKVLQR